MIGQLQSRRAAVGWSGVSRLVFYSMIKPLNSGLALAHQIQGTNAGGGRLAIWWLGQSGFLIKCGESLLLLDPYLSDSLSRKYNGTDKPHVRMSELVIAPDLLSGIRIITSSHNHTDHLDAETLLPLLNVNPQATLIVGEANRRFVADRLGCRLEFPVGLVEGSPIKIKDVTFAAVPSAHNDIDRDENGNLRYLGFIIRVGGWCLYHSGDTLVYPGLEDRLKQEKVDVAFLPINGNRPERRVAGNMNGSEAALLASGAGVKLVIPHHYHMFEFNSEEPGEFESACLDSGQQFRTPKLGELIMLEPQKTD